VQRHTHSVRETPEFLIGAAEVVEPE
jgi:hypothetical protein